MNEDKNIKQAAESQAMTSARTYVFVPMCCNQMCFVYFGSRFAYAVPYSNVFMEEVNKQQMVSVSQCGKYIQQSNDTDY